MNMVSLCCIEHAVCMPLRVLYCIFCLWLVACGCSQSCGNLILALPKLKDGKIVGHLRAASICVMFSGVEKIQSKHTDV
jgi:hypothetical protein